VHGQSSDSARAWHPYPDLEVAVASAGALVDFLHLLRSAPSAEPDSRPDAESEAVDPELVVATYWMDQFDTDQRAAALEGRHLTREAFVANHLSEINRTKFFEYQALVRKNHAGK